MVWMTEEYGLETVDLQLVLLGQATLDQQLADVLPLVTLHRKLQN
jgi:hypothetical protein